MTHYTPNWNSLSQHRTPQWFQDAKFGVYTHWGVYSVPACGPNATWYPYNMYREGTPQYDYHVRAYGHPSRFGYKDFIPQFTGERFDPDEWAELFRAAGAQFAGPVGEHHDGFCMWDTRLGEWNAARLGPRRDVVGELEQAIRRQGLRFMVALHHAENWWFYPHWRSEFDTADPRYAGLYGEPHNLEVTPGTGFFDQERPSRRFLEHWLGKTVEVIDRYRPDMLWFDFGLSHVPESYQAAFLAHYYNQADRWGQEVVVTYKHHDLPPNVAVVDLELGREKDLTYHEWITDTTVDDGEGWGYVRDTGYKPLSTLIHYLVDNVSKNGYLLLNVGPRPDGTLPEPAVELLRGMGRWLAINGEAIYGTTPWATYGEGPTQMERGGSFNEKNSFHYTAHDVRFTVKGDALYAICLGEPGERITIRSLHALEPGEIASVRMLGVKRDLNWTLDPDGLAIQTPSERPGEDAFAFKISRKPLV